MKDLYCINCKKPRQVGRRICGDCNKARLIALVRNKPRYTWVKNCKICKKDFKAWRLKQDFCSDCNELVLTISAEQRATNNYVSEKGIARHRQISEIILGRQLTDDEVVHHIDENPQNNDPKNLLIMYREDHIRLHLFLNRMKAFFRYNNCDGLYNRIFYNLTELWFTRSKKYVVFLADFSNNDS